jgi:hypothetical protein
MQRAFDAPCKHSRRALLAQGTYDVAREADVLLRSAARRSRGHAHGGRDAAAPRRRGPVVRAAVPHGHPRGREAVDRHGRLTSSTSSSNRVIFSSVVRPVASWPAPSSAGLGAVPARPCCRRTSSSRRPGGAYDNRNTRLTKWLKDGIPPARLAEWAGNSVVVLLATHARCVDGQLPDLKTSTRIRHGHPREPGDSRTSPGVSS